MTCLLTTIILGGAVNSRFSPLGWAKLLKLLSRREVDLNMRFLILTEIRTGYN